MILRRGVGLLLAGLLAGACGAPTTPASPSGYVPPPNPPRSADCAPPPAADLTTTAGWLGYVAEAPDDVAFLVDDGRGGAVSHGADTPMPLASAVKVVHLAAYARAVAEGSVVPDEPVPVADWQRWYLPTDGGAHEQALARLAPGPTVTVDEMVSAMVQESDNAAADWLRDRLGDDALVAAAADGGWAAPDLPSFLGASLALVLPTQAPPLDAPRAERGPAEAALARRHADDPTFRAEALRVLTATATEDPEGYLRDQAAWADRTSTGTATQLTGLHRALATGAFGPGSELARRHLEWQGADAAGTAVGFKGGAFTTVLTLGASLRRADGSVGSATVLARRMPVAPDAEVLGAQQGLVLGAAQDPVLLTRLACVA